MNTPTAPAIPAIQRVKSSLIFMKTGQGVAIHVPDK